MPHSVQSKQKVILLKKAVSQGEPVDPQVEDTLRFPAPRKLELIHQLPNGQEAKPVSFTFDKVFTDHDNQEKVFDSVKGVVKSALDGKNVCIFAYG